MAKPNASFQYTNNGIREEGRPFGENPKKTRGVAETDTI
jgi:hypothetical protein